MLPRKKEVVTVAGVCIFTVLLLIYFYQPVFEILSWGKKQNVSKTTDGNVFLNHSHCEQFKGSVHDFWTQLNLEKINIPFELSSSVLASNVVKSSKVLVKDVTIHYLYVKPEISRSDGISVLLLHGLSYSSATWENIGTIQMLGIFGYHTIAVDLPGFGKSPNAHVHNRGTFLQNLISALGMSKPVIVSPSMSGTFSLPFILKHWTAVGGFVPISPIGTRLLKESPCADFKQTCTPLMDDTCQNMKAYLKKEELLSLCCVQVPVMVVFGELDRGVSSTRLCHFPLSRGVQIPDGKHAAYLSNPDLWHKVLYNFLLGVETTERCK